MCQMSTATGHVGSGSGAEVRIDCSHSYQMCLHAAALRWLGHHRNGSIRSLTHCLRHHPHNHASTGLHHAYSLVKVKLTQLQLTVETDRSCQ